jgi:histidinol-phosphate aminotransferase
MAVVDNIKPSVRALGAYTLKAVEARVKLNQNESPFDLADEVKQRVVARVAARPWNRYPDFHPADVLEGLGALHGLTGSNVLIGNGSNELIQAVLAAVVGRGTPVAIPIPTFTLYAMMIAANDGEVRELRLTPDLEYDAEAWREQARRGDAHLLICTPNNPTGSVMSPALIDELATTTPRLVIVDEAYVQFGHGEVASLVSRHPNLIVLRTFSKAAGLAGVRFGYALANADMAREIGKVKLPYNVGLHGLEVAREVIGTPSVVDRVVQMVGVERERVADALAAVPVERVFRGFANFVLFRAERASELWAFLYARGVLIRDVGAYPMLAGCMRVSIGTPAENDEFIAGVRDFYATERT